MLRAHEWNFFERRAERERMWILLDTAFRRKEPDTARPWLLSVVVNTYGVADRKKSRREVLARLQRIEQRAERRFADELDAVYTARINTESRLEFYFYARSRERFDRVVDEIKELAAGLRVQALCKEDQEWSFYSYLCPDELENLLMRNTLFLESLQAKGDDGGEREVRHWMSFPDEASREAAKHEAEQVGFAAELCEPPPNETEEQHRLLLRKRHGVELDTINTTVRELHAISSGYGGRYEGWGAELRPQRMIKALRLARVLIVPVSVAICALLACILTALYLFS